MKSKWLLLIVTVSSQALFLDACVASLIPRFDVCTFFNTPDCTPGKHFAQAQFDALNWVGREGHYLAMPTANHRSEIVAAGNDLAAYYDNFGSDYRNAGRTADEEAAYIDQTWMVANFDNISQGCHPDWIILNEIPSGWSNKQEVRDWIIEVARQLHQTYNHSVIVCAMWANPLQNGPSWQALADNAYIGIENYLSGEEIADSGNSVSFAQSKYQSSIDSYTARGVDRSRLYLMEHFGQTLAGTGWGRAGVDAAEWDTAIRVRSTAAQRVNFAGFASYAWSGNDMGTCESDLVRFEQAYASVTLPSPEPSTFMLLGTGATIAFGYFLVCRRRKRRRFSTGAGCRRDRSSLFLFRDQRRSSRRIDGLRGTTAAAVPDGGRLVSYHGLGSERGMATTAFPAAGDFSNDVRLPFHGGWFCTV